MSSLSGLHGIIPPPLRWNPEGGVLGVGHYDESLGERTVEVIKLGTDEAKFALDLATREVGYGMARRGIFDLRTAPVGTPLVAWPGEDFKPALACWGWNPLLGEVRIETCSAVFRDAISALWDRCLKETTDVLRMAQVIQFIDRREKFYRNVERTFWQPVIHRIGELPRDRIPCFAAREPTVKLPPAQTNFALLETSHQEPRVENESKTVLKRGSPDSEDDPDDKISG
jgi:hypothetical protein